MHEPSGPTHYMRLPLGNGILLGDMRPPPNAPPLHLEKKRPRLQSATIVHHTPFIARTRCVMPRGTPPPPAPPSRSIHLHSSSSPILLLLLSSHEKKMGYENSKKTIHITIVAIDTGQPQRN